MTRCLEILIKTSRTFSKCQNIPEWLPNFIFHCIISIVSLVSTSFAASSEHTTRPAVCCRSTTIFGLSSSLFSAVSTPNVAITHFAAFCSIYKIYTHLSIAPYVNITDIAFLFFTIFILQQCFYAKTSVTLINYF